MAIRRLGRAWGNALGGWRAQARNRRGQFMGKMGAARSAVRSVPRKVSGDMRHAHRIGAMAQYRSTYREGGAPGARGGALAAAEYTLGAINAARKRGYFIHPEIGLSGIGVSVGYGQMVARNTRASVSVKVAVSRTDGGPVVAGANRFIDNSLGEYPGLYSLLKYGVMDTGIQDTVIVRNGDRLQMRSGRKANIARNKNPAYRASAGKTGKQYRAERRGKSTKSRNIGNGHKVIKDTNSPPKGKVKNIGNGHKVIKGDRYDESSHKNEFGTYNKYRKRRKGSRSNKKGVASTITA